LNRDKTEETSIMQTQTRRSDDETFKILKEELFTAVIGDVLDVMGYRRQFLPAAIGPLQREMKIAGRAMPVSGSGHFRRGHGPIRRPPGPQALRHHAGGTG
jgi:hypothetical protein